MTEYKKPWVLMLTTIVLALLSMNTHAWGREGHSIICAIAFQSLSKDQQQLLDKLTADYRTPDGKKVRYFTQGCSLPDMARNEARSGNRAWRGYDRFDAWHYTNLKRNQQNVARQDCPEQNCIFTGLDYHKQRALNSSLTNNERLEAILFYAHWVGDIHQPMHIAFGDDKGGNSIGIKRGSIYRQSNLHAVWDNGILENIKPDQSPWQRAKALRSTASNQQIKQWNTGDEISWAQESFDISIAISTGYCKMKKNVCQRITGKRLLDKNYQVLHQPIITERLQQAGIRLANRLNLLLASFK